MSTGFFVREVMEGTAQRHGDGFDRPFTIDFGVVFPSVWHVARTAVGDAEGSVRIDGLAKAGPAHGVLELSPLRHRTVRYAFDLTADDGRGYRFDGRKTIRNRHWHRSWTTLPGTIVDEHGNEWGTAVLRFSFRRHFRPLVRSFRFVRRPTTGEVAVPALVDAAPRR